MLNCREMAEQASDHIEKKLTLRQSISYGFHLLLCNIHKVVNESHS